ncbi:MAG: electron transfer flavoprotein beta subunit/FixA family protein [bacterium]|nr:electron transfer flavoprotein beta subunit/FixA family protein [bacterium]
MTVVVAYKWAADPGDATVRADGTIDWSRAKATISEYDPVAIAVARAAADATGEELVGISVGGAAVAGSMAKKAALSRGIDRLLISADDSTEHWNLTDTGRALAALATRAGATLVVTGDASIDESAHLVPAVLAGALGWPCFQAVSSLSPDGGGWLITQAIPGGQRTVRTDGPVVVAMSPDAAEVKIPGMKDILAAGKKPAEEVPLAELDHTPVGASLVAAAKPAARERKNVILRGPSAARELVDALAQEGALA